MRLHALVCLALLTSVAARAQEPSAVENQLREALRANMLQLRDAQAKTAEMEASVVQAEMALEKAKKETAGVQAQLVEERNTAANQAAELRTAVETAQERAVGLAAQVAKWEKDYRALAQRARKTEAALAQSKGRVTVLERAVAEQQVKHIEMKAIADEILDRYQRHGLGTALLAREPFISVNRAKLQTIMQDLETRIRAAASPAGAGASAPMSPPATNTANP
jgi:predicted  nucleic acid-binding Zn-ribbon protein